MRASDFDQSKYLKAADFKEHERRLLRIKGVNAITFEDSGERKLVVNFENSTQSLVLNKTTNRFIRGVFGDETDGWSGKSIVVFRCDVELRGRLTPGLRVRLPTPQNAAAPAVVMDGEEESAPTPPVKSTSNSAGYTLTSSGPPQPAKATKPSLEADLDDEIDF
jgi:hypothetical protein